MRAALLGIATFGACAVAQTDSANAETSAPDTGATQQVVAAQEAPAQVATASQPAQEAAQQPAAKPAATAQEADRTTLPSGKTVSLGSSRWDYKSTDFFKRISEYFTGEESTGYRIILRTDPQQRDGLYFQSKLSVPLRDLPEGSTLQLRFIAPDKADTTVTHSFAIPASLQNSGNSQLWLGLTGANVPANDAPPVAWQIRVLDAGGKQLAQTHSFLWSARDGR